MHKPTDIERLQFIVNCSIECKKLIQSYFCLEGNKENLVYSSVNNGIEAAYSNLSFHYFNQLWSNTSCGWGGISGSAFSYSKNFVAISKEMGRAFVFINRYAYTCKINEDFYKKLNDQELPGFINKGCFEIIDLQIK